MMDILRNWIIGIASAAILTGIALSLTPKGRPQSVLRFVCGIVMVLALIKPVMNIDFSVYSSTLADYRARANALGMQAEQSQDRLSRTIIEEECAAYILDKAQVLGLDAGSARVTVKWGDEGWWYPYEAYLEMAGPEELKNSLMKLIEFDLGIPVRRQYWS